MSQHDSFGENSPLGGLPGDDLGDFKVKRGPGVLIPIVFIIMLFGGGGGAFWYFAVREDPAAAHEAFRRDVFGPVHGEYYDRFWQCALNEPLANFKNNKQLVAKIQQNSSGGDAQRYGQHLLENEDCLPLLEKALPAYQSLKNEQKTPPEYSELLTQLSSDLENIKTSWSDFARFQIEKRERDDLRGRIKSRGEHWVGFQSSVNHKVLDKVAHYTPNAVVYQQYISCILGDTDFTSFRGGEGQSAQDQLLAKLDQECAQNRAAFLERIQNTCLDKLRPTTPPEPDDAFKAAADHWKSMENDFGSAMPLIECLSEYEESHNQTLIANIAKSWYGFSKTYRSIIDFSKAKSGSRT